MRLLSVELKNFRGYEAPAVLEVDDLTTIIGRNDVGKSTLLEALEIFFNNQTVKMDCGDCSVGALDKTVTITCEFDDLPSAIILDSTVQTTLAAEYLLTSAGTLRIRKTYGCSGAKPREEVHVLARHPAAKGYDDLLTLNNAALKKRLKELGHDGTGVQLSINSAIRRAAWTACEDLDLVDAALPVAKEDGKRIWEKLAEHLPLFALFQSDRASRDSDSEVQDPMKIAVAAALADPGIQQKLAEVTDAVRAQAVDLATRTQQTLAKIDPLLAQHLTPDFKADPKWSSLFSLELSSDLGIPVNKRGSGVRRLILVSFFRAEAERQSTGGAKRNIIYAIEEPETSQHPHNQQLLRESFADLAAEDGCQVLLTTHSPGFASQLPIDSFRFIDKSAGSSPQILPSEQATWEKLVAALGVVPDNRVRVLLCVEGPHDIDALKALSHALHVEDDQVPDLRSDPRVAFVTLGGGALVNWVNGHYLKGLGRPEVHIYDNDVAKYADSIDRVNARGDGSWGAQTTKREIENYLHPEAIEEGMGLTLEFGPTDDVPKLVAAETKWNPKNAKKQLAGRAFPVMTAARLRAVDPDGEVEAWFRRLEAML